MTAPATSSAVAVCDRLPCDFAYQQRVHTPLLDGVVQHCVSVKSCEGWHVVLVADGSGAWRIEVWRPPEDAYTWIDDPAEAADFAGAMSTAAVWLAQQVYARPSEADDPIHSEDAG